MTVLVESSALLKRYVDEEGSARVVAAMETDPEWVASEVALAEVGLTLCYVQLTEDERSSAQRRFQEDWQRFLVLPVDTDCLRRAAEIGCAHRVRTLDAIHVAAADRLTRPVTFLTFDRRQADAARTLGFDVVGVD